MVYPYLPSCVNRVNFHVSDGEVHIHICAGGVHYGEAFCIKRRSYVHIADQ